MQKNRKLFSIVLFLMFTLIFTLPVTSTEETKENIIKIKNNSNLERIQAPVEITLPEEYNYSENLRLINKKDSTELPVKRFEGETGPVLITQLNIGSGEEIELILEKGLKKSSYLPPSSSIGTEYAFVNYKRAILISTSDKNNIKVFTKDEKLIEEFELNKGKERIIEYDNPQFLILRAQKPIFVYGSSLSDHSKANSPEPGDSDTTTLYGNDLYIYTEKHLWLSSYEETNVKIYDKNDIEIFSRLLSKNSSLFLDNLNSGAYHLLSDKPLTVQFGYLDDENFSFIYGKPNNINGFAFGDLMVISKYPNTTVELTYNGKKRKLELKESNQFEIVPVITEFSQKVPESVFFTSTSNKPVLILTFSSGNNFGGEYIPGNNGLFLDNSFSFVTGRISKEFSKEQKNIISLTSVESEVETEVSGSIKSKAVLGKFTDFYLESNIPNGSVNIKSDKRILVNHLHNYRDKGLFYFVPPIKDNSLIMSFVVSPSNSNVPGIDNIDASKTNFALFTLVRIKDFFINIVSKDYLLFTAVFFILIGLLLSGIIIALGAMRKPKPQKEKRKEQKRDIIVIRESEERKPEKSSFKEISEEIPLASGNESPQTIPHLRIKEVTLPSFPSKVESKEEKVEKQAPTEKEVSKIRESEKFFEINLPIEREIFEEIKDKKIVLDPGSANRLYVENLLSRFSAPFICKDGSTKLSEEVNKLLKIVDLNRQEIERAKILSMRLSITEEAGKALILAKSINANIYITSYKLPNKVYRIDIIRVTELLKEL